jgi:CRISPR-associated protein Csm1
VILNSECESVICAALLHDIGKFMQRGYARQLVPHYKLSEHFVTECASSFPKSELVKALVGHHHESHYVPLENRPEAISDNRTRVMAYLISRADNLSSSERAEGEDQSKHQVGAMLQSVFEQVDIGRGIGKPLEGQSYRYRLSKLFEGSIYPELTQDAEAEIPEEEYKNHFDGFLDEFRRLFPSPYPRMSDTLLYLIRKYCWCIPSDTTRKPYDVSLADHLSTTAAIAACFYKWHESNNAWFEKAVKDDSSAKICLVCGDLSGIQNYIYAIASVGVGGVAKRLRGRSFKISLLTDMIALRLLRTLDLPLACRVMSAGGQFYLLIPNTKDALDKLEKEACAVESWLLSEYKGEIGLSIGSVELGSADLAQEKFDKILEELRRRVVVDKNRKYENSIANGPVVFELQYEGRQACSICGRRPADRIEDGDVECDDCRDDRLLGQKLVVENPWLVVTEGLPQSARGGTIKIFDSPPWCVSLVDEVGLSQYSRDSVVIVCSLRKGKLLEGVPSAFMVHAGYVPRWKNAAEVEGFKPRGDRKAKLPEKEELEKHREDFDAGRVIKSFSALAQYSEGAGLLGVIRSDVDHLGFIFTFGLANKASLSRISTMSSMLNIFFASEIESIISRDFPNVYTAYSGGDDLMLIGPWSELLNLSERIQGDFARFTCNNPNITMSTGFALFHATTPIALSSVQTGEILEKAKEAGRDSICLFGSVIPWSKFQTVREWMELLYEAASLEENALSSGFIYKLIDYHRMARDFFSSNGKSAKSAMYRPYLAYDIARNLSGEKVDEHQALSRVREKVIALIDGNESDWLPISAAASWCLYRLREKELCKEKGE